MYSFNSRVRYSECSKKSELTLPALINYFQDCSTFQSESLNLGREYFKKYQVAWILSSWQIEITRFPVLGEEITISTWPYDLQGFKAYRNFTMSDKGGDVIASASSIWVFMDIANGKLKRIDDKQKELYEQSPAYPMKPVSRKIEIPIELEEKNLIKVPNFCIDLNQHVNNEKYILIANEYAPHDYQVDSVRVEYKKAAMLGDYIYPHLGFYDDKIIVVLADENKKPYANIEFTVEKIDTQLAI